MGLGSFLYNHLIKKFETRSLLTITEILLVVCGALAAPLINFGHMLSNYSWMNNSSFYPYPFFLSAFSITLIVGLLTGIELPLLMKIARDLEQQVKSYTILGIDYLGSLIGAVLFPLVLLPNLELNTIGFIIAACNLLIAFYLMFTNIQFTYGWGFRALVSLAAAFGLMTAIVDHKSINQYFLQKYYYYIELSDSYAELFTPDRINPKVRRYSSAYQKIDIVEDQANDISYPLLKAYSTKFDREPNFPRKKILCLNGDFQTNSSYEELYHEYFAHVPIIAQGVVPKNVLVLGGGDGLLIRELVKYQGINKINHIDLDHVLISLAKNDPTFLAMNERSLHDPKVTTTINDGFYFIRTTDQKFDAIYIDFPMPADYDLAKLYSREFFAFIKKRLNENGFAVFDATGLSYLTEPDQAGNQQLVEGNDWFHYSQTLQAAGFEKIVPYLTTIEDDNPKVKDVMISAGVPQLVNNTYGSLLQNVSDPAQKIAIAQAGFEAIKDALVKQQVLAFQQGFIMVSNNQNAFREKFTRSLGVQLDILNPKRFNLAFRVKYPLLKEINYDYVNSIFRPSFPTVPIWRPRQPY